MFKWRAFFAGLAFFPIIGEPDTLYIDKTNGLMYIWDGLAYADFDGGTTTAIDAIINLDDNVLFYSTFFTFPIAGVANTLYADKTTGLIYDWNGINYILFGGGEWVRNALINILNLGRNVFFHLDFVSFPIAGITETLYIDKANDTIYIWDELAYVPIDGGKFIGNSSLSGVPLSRQIATLLPLAGGGDLSANRTLSLTTAGVPTQIPIGTDLMLFESGGAWRQNTLQNILSLVQNVLFYVNFAGFPVTGSIDTLYVDKANGTIYLWNGAAYVSVGGGVNTVLQNGNIFAGLMTIGTNDNFNLQFETNGTPKVIVETDGTLSVTTASYQALVLADNDIPNRRFVMDQITPLLGGVRYRGTYNATTNIPILADGVGTTGDYYVIATAGTQNFGSGNIVFQVSDWAIYNGTIWQKVDNTDLVTSVNGLQGIVVLTTTEITEGTNLYFTTARVLATLLTGFIVGANTPILATDTVLQAFAKIQGQINAIASIPNILQNGNTLGANVVVGSNDNFALQFETNALIRASISNGGVFNIANLTSLGNRLIQASATGDLSTTTIDPAGLIVQNGNTFGVLTTIGTNDNFNFQIETNGTPKFVVETDGTISVTTASYETLILADNDIPNRKFVTDLSANNVLQNGNSFGIALNVGTNDAFALQFKTNSITRLTVATTGLLSANTALYETLVLLDNDIPNRKFVTDFLLTAAGIELVQDIVGTFVAGTALNISTTYNDVANTFVIDLINTAVTANSYGSATQIPTFTVDAKGRLTLATNLAIAIPSTQVTDFTEAVQDVVGAFVVAGAGITATYNDVANTLTIANTSALSEQTVAAANVTTNIDLNLGNVINVTMGALTANTNLVITNPTNLREYKFWFTGNTNRNVTFPASFIWDDGLAFDGFNSSVGSNLVLCWYKLSLNQFIVKR